MRIERRLLNAGVFLVAVGAVLVVADAGAVDTALLADGVRLWPVAIIAIGAAIVLRRTRAGLVGGMLAAALPGVVLGSSIAGVPRLVGDCGARGTAAPVATEAGEFDGPATVAIRAGCGTLHVSTAPGPGWRLTASSTIARRPSVAASAASLEIESGQREQLRFLDGRRDAWDVVLPTTPLTALTVNVVGGHADLSLAGGVVPRLTVAANAAVMNVDASRAASVAAFAGTVRVGQLTLRLPATSDVDGRFEVGGGRLVLCAPDDLGLRVTSRGEPRGLDVGGEHESDAVWESRTYATSAHRADLTIHAAFGEIEINPPGGC